MAAAPGAVVGRNHQPPVRAAQRVRARLERVAHRRLRVALWQLQLEEEEEEGVVDVDVDVGGGMRAEGNASRVTSAAASVANRSWLKCARECVDAWCALLSNAANHANVRVDKHVSNRHPIWEFFSALLLANGGHDVFLVPLYCSVD